MLGNDDDPAPVLARLRSVTVWHRPSRPPTVDPATETPPHVDLEFRDVLFIEDTHHLCADVLEVEARGDFDRSTLTQLQAVAHPAEVLAVAGEP
ncbi:MAG: hypothetical protein QF642_16405 [Myxococcota bacterium]|nr:hypothetical protein [Myxococcota bacterium]